MRQWVVSVTLCLDVEWRLHRGVHVVVYVSAVCVLLAKNDVQQTSFVASACDVTSQPRHTVRVADMRTVTWWRCVCFYSTTSMHWFLYVADFFQHQLLQYCAVLYELQHCTLFPVITSIFVSHASWNATKRESWYMYMYEEYQSLYVSFFLILLACYSA